MTQIFYIEIMYANIWDFCQLTCCYISYNTILCNTMKRLNCSAFPKGKKQSRTAYTNFSFCPSLSFLVILVSISVFHSFFFNLEIITRHYKNLHFWPSLTGLRYCSLIYIILLVSCVRTIPCFIYYAGSNLPYPRTVFFNRRSAKVDLAKNLLHFQRRYNLIYNFLCFYLKFV